MESLLIGITSGILTTVIIYLVVQLFNKIFLPWYLKVTYKGVDISGKWSTKAEYELKIDDIVLDIKQRQQDIVGQIIIVKNDKKTKVKEIKNLSLTGKIIDGNVMLQAYNKDVRYQSFVSHLLKVSKGGTTLEGASNYLDSITGKIETERIQFLRNNS